MTVIGPRNVFVKGHEGQDSQKGTGRKAGCRDFLDSYYKPDTLTSGLTRESALKSPNSFRIRTSVKSLPKPFRMNRSKNGRWGSSLATAGG